MPLTPQELRAAIREDYNLFFATMNPRLKLARFQREIVMPAITRFEKGEWSRLAILLPPNHGKTTAITIPMPMFRMGNQPDKTVMLLSYSNQLAEDFGEKIKTGVKSKAFRSVFPNFRLRMGAQSKKFFRTEEGGSFYAIGLGGTVEGKRADLLLMDDPIQNMQEAMSAPRMSNLYTNFEAVVKTRLNENGQILLITTRWCLNDFVDRVMEKEGEFWKILALPAQMDSGEYLWPERFPPEHYESHKLNQSLWNAKFMQAPERGQGPWFASRNWILWYDKPLRPGKYNTYILVDPALRKEATSDRTSIMVICTVPAIPPSHDPGFILADWTLDRLDPGERQAEIIRLIKKWKPLKVGYEEVGLGSDSYHLKNAMLEARLDTSVIPLGRSGPSHGQSKENRIGNLVPVFRKGQIVMPRRHLVRLKNGETMDLIRYFLEEEYDRYAGKRTTRHDDALDCLSRILEPEMYFDHSVPGRKEKSTYYEPQGSWVVNYAFGMGRINDRVHAKLVSESRREMGCGSGRRRNPRLPEM